MGRLFSKIIKKKKKKGVIILLYQRKRKVEIKTSVLKYAVFLLTDTKVKMLF